MNETTGEITFMWKDRDSWSGGCPALFRAPDGGYFVQVKKVTDPAVRARLAALGAENSSPLGADEDFGYMPANVLDRLSS